MLHIVESVLSKKGGLKAKDILRELQAKKKNISKSDLNSLLYEYNKIKFTVSHDYVWTLIKNEMHEEKKSKQNFFEIIGKLISIDEPMEGIYQGRKWQKQDFIIESLNGREVFKFTNWNNKTSLHDLALNSYLKVEFKIKTRKVKNILTTYLIANKVDISDINVK